METAWAAKGSYGCHASCSGGCKVGSVSKTQATFDLDQPGQKKLCSGSYTCLTGAKKGPGKLTVSITGTVQGRETFTVCGEGPKCGDGVINKDNGEECDDGNTTDGDGCSSSCKIEPPTCPPDFQANACPANECEEHIVVSSKIDPSQKKDCYKCSKPSNDPCKGQTNVEGGLASGENDSKCQGCAVKNHVNRTDWICPPASSGGVVRLPTVTEVYCCKFKEGAITDKCAAKKKKCSVPTVDTCTYCILATTEEKCKEGSTYTAKECDCVAGTCLSDSGCNA